MPPVRQITLEILMDETGAIVGMKNINKATNDMEKTAKKSAQKMKSFTERIKDSWLKLTAATAGTMLALKKAFDFTKAFQKYKQSFDALQRTTGGNADAMIKKLREVSKGTIANKDLVLAANRAMALGVTSSMDDMAKLMEISRLRAMKMGLSTTQAFNDIVTGIGRGSPLILDNLGIITKGWAEEAKAAGTAYDVQFILNKVLQQGAKELKTTGEVGLTGAESIQGLTASFTNLRVDLGKLITPFLVPMINTVSKTVRAFMNLPEPIKRVLVVLTGAGGLAFALSTISKALLLVNMNPLILAITAVVGLVWGAVSAFKALTKTIDPDAPIETAKAYERAKKELQFLEDQINKTNEAVERQRGFAEAAGMTLEEYDESAANTAETLKSLESRYDQLNKRLREYEKAAKDASGVPLSPTKEQGEDAEDNFSTLKATATDYYAFLENQREVDLLAEKEAYKKALKFAMDNGMQMEEINRKHAENINAIHAEAEKRRFEKGRASLDNFAGYFGEIEGRISQIVTDAADNRVAEIEREAEGRQAEIEADYQRQLEAAQAQLAMQQESDLARTQSSEQRNNIMQSYEQRRKELEEKFATDKAAKEEAVEKQKEKKIAEAKKKQFNYSKTISIITTIINTAQAIMKAYAELGPIGGAIMAVILSALGVAQIALIAAKQPPPTPGFKEGGQLPGYGGGDRIPIMAEGGEYMVRKERVTPSTLPILEAINNGMGRLAGLAVNSESRRLGFQRGGMVPEAVTYGGDTFAIEQLIVAATSPEELTSGLIDQADAMGLKLYRRKGE